MAQTKAYLPNGNKPKAGEYVATFGVHYYEIYSKDKPQPFIHANGGAMAHCKYPFSHQLVKNCRQTHCWILPNGG